MNGGGSGVRIPNDVKKLILKIKEVVRNTSDEEIHAMLKGCGMDVDQATQRLVEFESFEMVVSKRDKKRLNAQNKAPAYHNRGSVPHGRGEKGYNGYSVSRQVSHGSMWKKSSSGKGNLNKENKMLPPNLPASSEAERKEPNLLSPASGKSSVNARCDNAASGKSSVNASSDNAVKKPVLSEAISSGSDSCVSSVSNVATKSGEAFRKPKAPSKSTQRVIFAQHLLVPESEIGAFSFGSFTFSSNENAEKPSLVQDSLIAPLDGDSKCQKFSTPVPDSLSTEKEQSKQESTPTPFAVSQSSSAQITENLGLFTPVISGQFTDLNNSDREIRDASRLLSFNGRPFVHSNSGSTQFTSQLTGVFQSPLASTQLPVPELHHYQHNPHSNSGSTQFTSQLTGVVQSPLASTQLPVPELHHYQHNPYYNVPQNMNYYSSYFPPTHNFMGDAASLQYPMGNAASLQQPPVSVFPAPVLSATAGNYPQPQFKYGVNTES